MNVLIPRFRQAFTLNYFQAMLVQFAFYGIYGTGRRQLKIDPSSK
jgi:FHS family L-fucose permease-like MFS transporter